jgi:hypothetical protein
VGNLLDFVGLYLGLTKGRERVSFDVVNRRSHDGQRRQAVKCLRCHQWSSESGPLESSLHDSVIPPTRHTS